mmetsp:Transcript_17535/g.27036  ORF Transcript_17535/g.27036 Transcript_17535/m.27036 type:complete len:92 (+) Transcript_17535:686-961(+)
MKAPKWKGKTVLEPARENPFLAETIIADESHHGEVGVTINHKGESFMDAEYKPSVYIPTDNNLIEESKVPEVAGGPDHLDMEFPVHQIAII